MRRPSGRVVIVGGGVAGLRVAEALRGHGFSGELLGIGAEDHAPYARPPLSKAALHNSGVVEVLASSATDVRWNFGTAAVDLDLAGPYVRLDDGRLIESDAVVIATGVRARTLPGMDRTLSLRTVEDAERLRGVLAEAPGHLVIIGAGFIGSEVAVAARARNWEVTVVDAQATPLAAALGPAVAQWLWEQHRARGVHTRFGQSVRSTDKAGTRWHVSLDNGAALEADAVVTGLGAKPNTEWLGTSGLDVSDGVLTDERRRAVTADGAVAGDIVAIGDVARTPSALTGGRAIRWEHWTAAVADARRAATVLVGLEPPPELPTVFWTDVYQDRVQVLCLPSGTESEPEPGPRGFCVRYDTAGVLSGAVAVNWPQRLAVLQREIAKFGVTT
ncbi:3-phenylpropionate/trans-cinnamate dioxygenase ferredoxin reductase subunit [Amycolatopsis marina]|uniref:3-phenylpropionate/trans-cinnamate dioxygenase ferredoxin reductase subunit n=1 Tax=Amycolatopsis marina TaxID=490629 RepID=A0A1I1C6U4_9PSEU|nr:FAD-dependent oxidoreductase [Amycolatopsis marina]SFB56608.1 3-phenylpropionate/trans-cinnamate dioxygenase ferredoxin reductase subunit [Amycolatopsis marina]